MESDGRISPSISYRIIYLLPVLFITISLCIFVWKANKETIIYYAQFGKAEDKDEAIKLMKKVVDRKDDEYFNNKFQEIKEKGEFISEDYDTSKIENNLNDSGKLNEVPKSIENNAKTGLNNP